MQQPLNSTSNVVASSSFQVNPVGLRANQEITHGAQSSKEISEHYRLAQEEVTRSASILKPLPSSKDPTAEYIRSIPVQQPSFEEISKVYVGKIPKGVSDEFMERVIKCVT